MKYVQGWAPEVLEAIGCPARAVSAPVNTASGVWYSGRCLLRGWSLENRNAGSQVIEVRDGLDASGQLVAAMTLAANARDKGGLAAMPVLCELGVFIVIPAGPLVGALWLTPVGGWQGVAGPGEAPE